MNKIKYVVKRDTKRVSFDKRKIAIAIFKAAEATEGNTMRLINAEKIANNVEISLANMDIKTPDIETIQDCVEKALIDSGFSDVAKNYISYRKIRNQNRKNHNKMKKILIKK